MRDTARGILTFHDTDTPPAPGLAVAAGAIGAGDDAGAGDSSEDDADDDSDSGNDTEHGDGTSTDDEEASESSSDAESVATPDPPAPFRRSSPVRFGRLRGRRSALRAATAFVRKGLSPDDMKLLEGSLKARSAYVDVPDVLVMAAKIRPEGMRVPENLSE